MSFLNYNLTWDIALLTYFSLLILVFASWNVHATSETTTPGLLAYCLALAHRLIELPSPGLCDTVDFQQLSTIRLDCNVRAFFLAERYVWLILCSSSFAEFAIPQLKTAIVAFECAWMLVLAMFEVGMLRLLDAYEFRLLTTC